jgi:outer membrane protein OmpA-like peptidoglycan-associated protein
MHRALWRPGMVVATMMVLGGCGSKDRAVVTPPAAAAEPAPQPAAPPMPEPAPPPPPAPRAPAVLVVKPGEFETTWAARRQTLVGAGRRVSPDEIGYYMDVQQARLQQIGGHWLSVIRKGHRVQLSLPGRWSFKVGSAELSSTAQSALSSVARVLADYCLSLITVHGHTDDSGDPAFNQALSERRALAVAKHLVSEGVALDRVLVVGHGAAKPLASNASEDGREENRRVELQVDPLTDTSLVPVRRPDLQVRQSPVRRPDL